MAWLADGLWSRRPRRTRNSSMSDPDGLYPGALGRALLREICNLPRRIQELRRKRLDRSGIRLNPLIRTGLPLAERERVLADCMRDMRDLFDVRPWTTSTEAELFARGWHLGAESAWYTTHTRPDEEQREPSEASLTDF
jgi:hypothetical protein